MIIRTPFRVRMDSGDPSSLSSRTVDDSGSLAVRSWRSRVKRQEGIPPCPIVDLALSSPSVAPPPLPSSSLTTVAPSFPPVVPSFSPVVTSPTPSLSSSNELDPKSPSPRTPLETAVASSSKISPSESTPFWSYPPPVPDTPTSETLIPTYYTESSTETTSVSSPLTLLPIPTPTKFTSDESPILLSTITSANNEPDVNDNGLDTKPRLNSAVINVNDVTLDAMRQEDTTGAHTRMIGAIVGSVFMVGLVLSGVIFYLRRRVRRKSLRRGVVTTRATPDVPSHPVSPRVMEQQESRMSTPAQDPFPGRSSASIRDSVLTVAATQGQCSRLSRYSQISASSSSKSMKFVVKGSYHSPTSSDSSQTTLSVVVKDAARPLTGDPFAGPASPHSPVSADTITDHSAPWRGTNLSNIINAARGIKT